MSFARLRMPVMAGAAVFCLFAVPTAFAEEATSPPKAENEASTDGSQKVCKKLDDMTGSRLSKKKICKTRAEWNAEREAAKRDRD